MIQKKLTYFFILKCWEDKLRKRLTTMYLNNQYINTPNGYVKPQIGSAAAAAVSDLYNLKIKTEIFFFRHLVSLHVLFFLRKH